MGSLSSLAGSLKNKTRKERRREGVYVCVKERERAGGRQRERENVLHSITGRAAAILIHPDNLLWDCLTSLPLSKPKLLS